MWWWWSACGCCHRFYSDEQLWGTPQLHVALSRDAAAINIRLKMMTMWWDPSAAMRLCDRVNFIPGSFSESSALLHWRIMISYGYFELLSSCVLSSRLISKTLQPQLTDFFFRLKMKWEFVLLFLQRAKRAPDKVSCVPEWVHKNVTRMC